ncbi:MAG: adaptor protein MecA [Ruminococcaceae bacterium]|nr:adaptor protein MecA [Oscillospiraceae bacterium]
MENIHMELILISNTKLKIMLDESDMRKYHIGNESDCADSGTRKAIRSLLERARDQIGFNTEGEEIFVQLYTSKRGGCELFVTKSQISDALTPMEERLKSPVASKESADQQRRKAPRLPEGRSADLAQIAPQSLATEEKPLAKSSRIAFSFAEPEDLFAVCKALNRADIRAQSRAFTDDEGKYYLLLLDVGMSAYSRLDKLTFILEYGRRENPDCLLSYVNEHGKVICREKAIETLCNY